MAKSKSRRSATRRSLRRAPTAPAATFAPDYTYIKQDLKRIATLAVSYVVVLVALSFVLR